MLKMIRQDLQAVFDRDPAATSALEVILTYAGFHALIAYSLAHWLKSYGIPFLPRAISQLARWLTGIEIHPSARIGMGFFIDHGMGVVIGETAEIGDYVTLFQGVTLGGTGKERGNRVQQNAVGEDAAASKPVGEIAPEYADNPSGKSGHVEQTPYPHLKLRRSWSRTR